jgi:hypothetical protein
MKREFLDLEEDGEAAAAGYVAVSPSSGPLMGIVGEALAVHYNRMHFLAGRRSWRVGDGTLFGVEGDVTVLETSAVERMSARFFQAGDYVLGLEEKIPDIWIAMLNNFIRQKGLNPLEQHHDVRPWRVKYRNIYYFVKSDFQDLNSLKAHPEFLDAYPLFPTILP